MNENVSQPSKTVVVSGDISLDWNLARRRRSKVTLTGWSAEDHVHTCFQPGGSLLTSALVRRISALLGEGSQAGWQVLSQEEPPLPCNPGNPHFRHSYAAWKEFPRSSQDSKNKAWRVEEFLGMDPIETQDGTGSFSGADTADLVILDDSGSGIRSRPDDWPKVITDKLSKPIIIYKVASPVAHGLLWDHLLENHAERLIVLMSVDDLRQTEVQISRQISWERTAQDIAWELVYNPNLNNLTRCAWVVLTFRCVGAVICKTGKPDFSLVFDPAYAEGAWESEAPGGMIGYNTCITAALAAHVIKRGDLTHDIVPAIQAGLSAQRLLHLEGFGSGSSYETISLQFPIDKVAQHTVQQIHTPNSSFACVKIQPPVRHGIENGHNDLQEPGFWTILNQEYANDLKDLPRKIVLDGPEKVVKNVPLGRFGKLLSLDRREIESIRSICSLVSEYAHQESNLKPLSIAVFGSPGSGKSFAIKELTNSLLPGKIQIKEFNLSQFSGEADLLDAMHQVRDIALGGKMPLVFWDEFDTSLVNQDLGWLRFFLAPMQDGTFQEGQITHPIGRCIFVFAGGTSSSMGEFTARMGEHKREKMPDFVSRLKGFVDVLGPNRKSANDLFFKIRRAILLRSLLSKSAGQCFENGDGKGRLNIQDGVLRAFLDISVYHHGARSMESIISMSQLAGRLSFERSCLPSQAQLNLHVPGAEFMALVQKIEIEEAEILEKLAEANHEIYCDELRKEGYQLGERDNDDLKTSSRLIPYAQLSDDLKRANRQFVRDIPDKLAAIKYMMRQSRSDQLPEGFPGDDLEWMAEAEHNRWMLERLSAGWSYAPKRDNQARLHPSLLPWRAGMSELELEKLFGKENVNRIGRDGLPEQEKKKDRILLRGIPRALARVGYVIFKITE